MKQILIAGLITLTLSVDNALAQSRDDWPSPIPNEYFGILSLRYIKSSVPDIFDEISLTYEVRIL